MAHLALAESLAQSGHDREALRELDSALEENPELADAHFFKGALLVRHGAIDEAFEHLRTATRLDPDNAKPRLMLAWLHLDQNQPEEALRVIQPALHDPEQRAAAYHLQGDILSALDRTDEAIDSYRAAIECNPQMVNARLRLGQLLCDLGKHEEAIQQLLAVQRLNPLQPMARVSLGDALRAQGRLDDAIEHYRAASELNAKLGVPFARLGEAYLEKDLLAEAIEALKTAVRVDPQLFDPQVDLGRAYLRLGQYQEAIEMFQAAIALDDREPRVRELLAEAEAHAAQAGELPPSQQRAGNDEEAGSPDARDTDADDLPEVR